MNYNNRIVYILLFLFILSGCTQTNINKNDKNFNSDDLTLKELKEIYGPASEYNVNTTTVELTEVILDSKEVIFNFNFNSNRNVAELFRLEFYEKKYNVELNVADENHHIIFESERFDANIGDGNDPFQYASRDEELMSIFKTEAIIYITLNFYNSEDELFIQYNFVGSAHNFVN